MNFKHISVLLDECIDGLNIKEDGIYVDGTLGGAGHGFAVGERLSERGCFIGFDQDKDALLASSEKLEGLSCKVKLIHANYEEMITHLHYQNIFKVDGILLDLGVSSYQLDTAERGFSYMRNAPLDMRMNQENDVSAEKILATYSQEALTRILKVYGEERLLLELRKQL